MVHAVGGYAIDGQNDVSDTHLGSGCFASIGELQRRQHYFYLQPETSTGHVTCVSEI